jgi:CheY-like chemotaxis protein
MRSYRLLIVDDDVTGRRLFHRSSVKQPEYYGCHVQQAINGAAGLLELRASTFHCVLLKYNLPDMTACEFLTAASVDGRPAHAVVLVTKQGSEVDSAEATEHGVDGYLAEDETNTTNIWRAVTQAVMRAELRQRRESAVLDRAAADLALDRQIANRQAVELEPLMGEQTSRNGDSLFWYEVPAEAPASQPRQRPVKYASPPSYRVLVVDDIEMNRSLIGALLGHAGHAVTEAEGGEEAVWLASENAFDVVLMDVRMPIVDGLEATRRIRALAGAHCKVPILALTAHTSLDQKAKCRDAGMNGHLAKPVDYDTLISAVDNVVDCCAG